MPKDLERDLGLPSVVAISIGAMVGSGIFILPALAVKEAGAGVVLAYLFAGVLVLPAALSKAEMATAMPEAGGTYVYIERSMGPLLGTIAGVGTWFSLSFKGALALVGGVPYLLLLFDLPVRPVAIALAALLVVINVVGAEQTGRLQVGIVAVMLAAMAWFVVGGGPAVETAAYDGLWSYGAEGIFAATGLVFVSYAGVTKISSVAEEIEDPDRVIPLAMLGSLAFTTLLYVLIVAVIVGVVPLETVAGSSTPVADAADATLGVAGVGAVVLAALLALVSTANAGILSASRYPFAMARDALAPSRLSEVSDRFTTPVNAITLTGGVMLILIAFVPILEIAKLASAFKILVFALINVALVGFRESDTAVYDPSFESPLYPWTQVFGALTGFALLTQMGAVAIVGAAVITAGSTLWYLWYVRRRVSREGAIRESMRQSVGQEAVERTETALDDSLDETVLVALPEDADRESERTLLELASTLCSEDGRVAAVQFDEVPDQTPLRYASSVQTGSDVAFERRTDELSAGVDARVEYAELVSHHPARAVANAAADVDADLLLVDRDATFGDGRLRRDVDRIRKRTDCDTLAVQTHDLDDVAAVTLVATRGPYDPTKVRVGAAIADATGASLRLVYPLPERSSTEQRHVLEAYHADLVAACSVPTEATFTPPTGLSAAVSMPDAETNIVLHGRNGGLTAGLSRQERATRAVIDDSDHATITVHSGGESARPLRRVLDRLAF
ncbi:APC family permease [Halomicroarcula sp. S1AR25-4]|uniref:APC family permease n=1 Tax=Haloarcula sp. S1AR25-4 TaxID=2950538 RepID=UPI002876D434|nr:APC family permease [Halomicroarcula sp. S1AR25-4]MDS0277499.1 APC family permease [Halomicroarcula sp. S1AR25-4]